MFIVCFLLDDVIDTVAPCILLIFLILLCLMVYCEREVLVFPLLYLVVECVQPIDINHNYGAEDGNHHYCYILIHGLL